MATTFSTDLYTPEVWQDLAQAEFKGKAIIGTSSAARAMQIYEEDVRLQNISDFQSAANDAERAGDKAEADYIRKETNETYLRSGGMNWNSRGNR